MKINWECRPKKDKSFSQWSIAIKPKIGKSRPTTVVSKASSIIKLKFQSSSGITIPNISKQSNQFSNHYLSVLISKKFPRNSYKESSKLTKSREWENIREAFIKNTWLMPNIDSFQLAQCDTKKINITWGKKDSKPLIYLHKANPVSRSRMNTEVRC